MANDDTGGLEQVQHARVPASAPIEKCSSSLSVCATFRELSAWTWNTLAAAVEFNMPFQEETITDILLLELAKRCPYKVKLFPFSKKTEAKNGADWEWWFCDWPHGVGFRIQAKRINCATWCFDSLKFGRRGQTQVDALISKAAAAKLVPFYCLYVSESRSHRSPGLFQDRFGCRLVRADTVASLESKKGYELMPYTVPWHHMVCDGASGDRDPASIAKWANGLGSPSEAAISLVQELPPYVSNRALDKKRHASPRYEDAWSDLVGEHPSRGIVIVHIR